jgi:hypothetical protein
MNEITYGCCFCDQPVSSSERSSDLDPCALVLIAHFDRPRSEQKEQEFYCHFECLRKAFKTVDEMDDELKAETGALL